MPKHYHLSVNSDLNNLPKVLDWFQQLHPTRVAEQEWLECQIALAEGFTNAVSHAHQSLPPTTPIQLELGIELDHVEIRIWDQGPTFDLRQYLQHHPTFPSQDMGGGRGLLLINRIADNVQYRRIDNCQNCLSIVKYLSLNEPIH
ncbi:ATP-binding protein [Acaryochloris marina]|uniref:Anti-sigma regulatory factor n=1 Tax=Acaryochloris marina (strain MBIC 11017) TaxID=329726 RepID=B0C2X9_ACAM1|nr:anti-sigma regulatory factor [Acaryochloris marina]ABW26195.1 anti-sigma regulatory factor [Acaryochloris marina MBIC11017]